MDIPPQQSRPIPQRQSSQPQQSHPRPQQQSQKKSHILQIQGVNVPITYRSSFRQTSHYTIDRISLFNDGIELDLYKSPSLRFMALKYYFFQKPKPMDIPARPILFRIIDAIAKKYRCRFTYIPDDVHVYIVDAKKLYSRPIDVLTGRKTFYQRAWPGSTLVRESSIKEVIQGKTGVDTLQSFAGQVDRQRQEWDQVLPPEIRQQAQRVRTTILQRTPQAAQGWQVLKPKIDSLSGRARELYWHFINEYDIVVKFYDA